MFHLYNLPRETDWQHTFNKSTMYGAVGVNTNSSYGKMYGRRTVNIAKNRRNFQLQ